MPLGTYLYFNGNCREAVTYYAQVFGTAEPRIMTYGEGPANPSSPIPESDKNLVLHAEIDIHGTSVMFSDVPSTMPVTPGTNINLVVVSKDLSEIQALYEKLKEGGTVRMPLQETFWSKGYAMVTDKFGIPWELSHDSEQTVSQ